MPSEQVVPKRLHKGVVVSTILRTQRERRGSNPDFVFCVGDDASDEQMFSAVYSFLAQAEEQAGCVDCLTVPLPLLFCRLWWW